MANENLESRTGNPEYEGLTPEQVTAIKKSISLGRNLQILHPEIAEDYRKGMNHKEIAAKYSITEEFGENEEVARTSVGYSIRGAVKMFGLESYSGLIEDEEELERLAQEHHTESGKKLYEQGIGAHGMSEEEKREARIKGGRKSGKRNYERGIGIFGMSKEEKREVSRKSGKRNYERGIGIHGMSEEEKRAARRKGGENVYGMGIGIHGMSEEERREAGRKGGIKGGKINYEQGIGIFGMSKEELSQAGRKGIISRGYVPYTDREKRRILELHREIGKGKMGKNKRIIQIVNQEFHEGKEVRSAKSVGVLIIKLEAK